MIFYISTPKTPSLVIYGFVLATNCVFPFLSTTASPVDSNILNMSPARMDSKLVLHHCPFFNISTFLRSCIIYRYRKLIKSYKLTFMFPSLFILPGFGNLLPFDIAVQRLNFPNNVSVLHA